jgi:hypothetical protein
MIYFIPCRKTNDVIYSVLMKTVHLDVFFKAIILNKYIYFLIIFWKILWNKLKFNISFEIDELKLKKYFNMFK